MWKPITIAFKDFENDYCVILRPCWNITFDNINRTEKLQGRTTSETKN